MAVRQLNPYQSPSPNSEPIRIVKSGRAWLPVALLALVALATSAYHIFIVLLLVSPGSDDQKAGLLFLLNSPVLAMWIFDLVRADRRSSIFGFGAVALQILILVIMAMTGIGEFKTVCEINGCIMLGFGILAGACLVFVRRRADPQSSGASTGRSKLPAG